MLPKVPGGLEKFICITELAKPCDSTLQPTFRDSWLLFPGHTEMHRAPCTRVELSCGISQHQQYDETFLHLGPVSSWRSGRAWLSRNNRILSSLNHLDHADWLPVRANHFAWFFVSYLPCINVVKVQDKIKSSGLNFMPLSLNTFSLSV